MARGPLAGCDATSMERVGNTYSKTGTRTEKERYRQQANDLGESWGYEESTSAKAKAGGQADKRTRYEEWQASKRSEASRRTLTTATKS
jgi:hypothetical protein